MPRMSRRQVFALVVVAYLAIDLSTPWLPGMFSFDDDDVFIETVMQRGGALVRLLGDVAPPCAVVVAATSVATPASPSRAIIVADAGPPGAPDLRRNARSSLAPTSLDDH